MLFKRPLRYSEDIDLVQRIGEPIGQTGNAIREALSWLGKCDWKQSQHSLHLVFKFEPEDAPGSNLKLKIEINTREHESLFGFQMYPFSVTNRWFESTTTITSYKPEELFGTKLRALLQRRKNRDLFDIHEGIGQLSMDKDKVVACLEHYLQQQDSEISRANAERVMLGKLNSSLIEDVEPLLPTGVSFNQDEAIDAFNKIWTGLISQMRGDPWKLSEKVIAEIREKRYPNLLRNMV